MDQLFHSNDNWHGMLPCMIYDILLNTIYIYIPCFKYDCLHTQDTTGSLQYHLSYVVCGEVRSFCPFDNLYTCSVKLFNPPNWTYQALGVYSVLIHRYPVLVHWYSVPVYQCTSTVYQCTSTVLVPMYQYNVSAQCTQDLAFSGVLGPGARFWGNIAPTYIFGRSPKHLQNDILFFGASWKSKNAILHCKMYVFAMFWRSKMQKTYILHCKMYVFPILEWNFKIPSLKLKPQSQKHTFYTVKCMFFQIWTEISRFQASNWSPKVKNIHFTL